MTSRGVVIRGGADEVIESRARRAGLGVYPLPDHLQKGEGSLPFDKNLIVEAGTRVPWDLLPAAWHFLDRWDAAVPLWKYGVLASDVGTAEEREVTRFVVRDLRVLLHSVELLFVRNNDTGKKLMHSWKLQMEVGDGEERLAFLRALYIEKPRLCVLPTTWLAEVHQNLSGAIVAGQRLLINKPRPMVVVEVAPGKLVKCYAGDEAHLVALQARHKESEMAVVSNKSFTLENQKVRGNKGPLIRVNNNGRMVKMYEADAIAAGLVKPKDQPARPAQEGKARPAEENKQAPPPAIPQGKMEPAAVGTAPEKPAAEESVAAADDLTQIEGVGKATARQLAANGIDSFAALRQATDLSFINGPARLAIEEWVKNG